MTKDTCKVEGCDRPRKSLGWCNRCYMRWRLHGDPTDYGSRIHGDDEARFWSKVNKKGPIPDYAPHLGPCWLWTATEQVAGYGRLKIQGRSRLAHHWAYEQYVGPIPDGMEPDHLCRVRLCVNYERHLEPVTHQENCLRGAQGDWQKIKTECPAGHGYDEENTYMDPKGYRSCHICGREKVRRHRALRRGAA